MMIIQDLEVKVIALSDISSREIPIISIVDVLVIGGGTSGSLAAISSAKMGFKTLIVEQFGFLGGTQTGALVSPAMNNHSLNKGLESRIIERMEDSATFSDGNSGWFNPEELKFVLEEMCIESKVSILYFTQFEDTILKKNTVRGVTVVNKNGLQAIFAKRIIDATGDADVAARAQVKYFSGNNIGKNQPLSLRFHVGNVDMKKLIKFLKSLGENDIQGDLIHSAMVWNKGFKLEPIFRQALKDGVIKHIDGEYFQFFSINGRPGELSFNCPRLKGFDPLDAFSISNAIIKGRVSVKRYMKFLKKYIPGCEDCYLVFVAPMIGVRDSRRIDAVYNLDEEDVVSGRKFEDAICRNSYPLDVHLDENDGGGLFKINDYHEVPYRALVPKKIKNLIVAGRSIGCSFMAQSSIRIISNCRAIGEAAGVASAISIQEGVTFEKLDGRKVRNLLRKFGSNL